MFEILLLLIMLILVVAVIIISLNRIERNRKNSERINEAIYKAQEQNEARLNNTLKLQQQILEYTAKDLEMKEQILDMLKDIKESVSKNQ